MLKPEAQDLAAIASGLAHDLNNLLLVLQGCLDLLRLSGGSDSKLLESMQRGITEGTNLCRQLGEVCRQHSSRTVLSSVDQKPAASPWL